jgi:hypothetical protein
VRRKILSAVCMVLAIASVRVAARDEEVLSLRGLIVVDMVDTQRIIVAVDSNRDGTVEHLFLYTASERLRVTPRMTTPGEAQYREGDFLLVKPAGGMRSLHFSAREESEVHSDNDVIRFDRTAGLSQYIPIAPISIKDLASKRVTADCASSPASCVEVAGQLLPFPA